MWLCSSGTSIEADIGNSGKISGWNIACGPNFGVNKNGNVYLSGKITATSGKIGDWEITSSTIGGIDFGDYLLSKKIQEDNTYYGIMLAPKDVVPIGGTLDQNGLMDLGSWVIAVGEIDKYSDT
jgi:hypothetical protein